MREYYLYEIETSELPIFDQGEWEEISNLTSDANKTNKNDIAAYGEIKTNKYVALYEI